MGSKFIPQGQKNLFFDAEQKKRWAEDPKEYLRYRKDVEKELNIRFPLFIRDTPQQAIGQGFHHQRHEIGCLSSKPELQDILMPSFAVGCRRPTPGTGYLEGSIC